MSILYRPVLIESAEHAEALPEGTVVINTRVGAIEKSGRGYWWSGFTQVPDRTALGGTALVPVEAEEVRVIASGGLERDQHGATVLNHTPDGPRRDYRRTEFHTPWEEVAR